MNNLYSQFQNLCLTLLRSLTSPAGASIGVQLSRGAVGSFILKISSAGLTFAMSVLLARLLGVSDFGKYAFAVAWINLLLIPAVMGTEQLLVREIAAYQVREDYDSLYGILRWANRIVLMASVVLALIASGITVSQILLHGSKSQMLPAFLVALPSLPLLALTRVRQAALRGLHHVVISQVPEVIVRPILLMFLAIGAYLFLGARFNASWAMGMLLVATACTFCLGIWLLHSKLPPPIVVLHTGQGHMWLRNSLPLLLFSGAFIVNDQISLVLLGALRNPTDVGLFTVAQRGSEFVVFPLSAMHMALAPSAARLFALGDKERLQHIIMKSARITFALAVPIALFFVIFGYWYLLLFGAEFVRGQNILAILSAAQVVNTAMGSAGLLLVMTGYERYATIGIVIGILINFMLGWILIPRFGPVGAAIAEATSMALWTVLLAWWAYQKTGILSIALVPKPPKN